MNYFFSVLITLLVLVAVMKTYSMNRQKIDFFSQGLSFGFHSKEIAILWKLAKESDLEDAFALFVSENALNKCITAYLEQVRENGTESSFKVQSFLEKLYKFKTKVALELDKKRGLDSSRSIDVGQRISIILKGRGVFFSKVLSNGHELVVTLPMRIDKTTKRIDYLAAEDWVGKEIAIYLWRKKDACYTFDTTVFNAAYFRSDMALYLKHSFELERIQKRKSIRCDCQIYASLFFITEEKENIESEPEYENGYKCLLEDISEDGAMIRTGGKAKNNIQIKLQFTINDSLVIMCGVVRAVEYNEKLDQSRLHFECTKILPEMKNLILSYVYNIMPEDKKELKEAYDQIEEQANRDKADEDDDKNSPSDISPEEDIVMENTSALQENSF